MQVIYGSELSAQYKAELKEELAKYAGFRPAHLVVIMVGDNPASLSYALGKKKACEAIGMRFTLRHLPEAIAEDELLEIINEYNYKEDVDGIIVQLPLPKHLNERRVLETVLASKDIDGLTTYNMGKLFLQEKGFYPCTPLGVMAILKAAGVDLRGKRVSVIGRSMLVGLPLARLLTAQDATVTLCHSKTEKLQDICKQSDILIVAIGKARFINHEYIKEGAVVIDVGVNRLDGHLCGDVDFDDVKDLVSVITPVPKGVGPMTIAFLLSNTVDAYKRNMGGNTND